MQGMRDDGPERRFGPRLTTAFQAAGAVGLLLAFAWGCTLPGQFFGAEEAIDWRGWLMTAWPLGLIAVAGIAGAMRGR